MSMIMSLREKEIENSLKEGAVGKRLLLKDVLIIYTQGQIY
jgi:hypothetical protein